jgi:glycosyltransferase involved in cell wall biosynthesis
MARILFLVPYPLGVAPSQRFRFEQYFGLLREHGHEVVTRPFLDDEAMLILYRPGFFLKKTGKVIWGLCKRVRDMVTAAQCDMVFIHREAAPVGPPVFEFIVSKILRKRVIFDFDDAIWIPNASTSNSIITHFKRYGNAETTSGYANVVSCGNAYLRDHATRFNSNAVINPTTIDTDGLHNRTKAFCSGKPVIGWTGTHSTIRYLDHVVPALQRLEQEFDFTFLVIADRPPDFALQSLSFTPWTKVSEIEDLLRMDVGIMPLEDDRWARGKCGFKALQYMALGIPAIVSPVGVNTEIVSHGINGWVCATEAEWETCLRSILSSTERLAERSAAARDTVVSHYSVKSNSENFLSLFRKEQPHRNTKF